MKLEGKMNIQHRLASSLGGAEDAEGSLEGSKATGLELNKHKCSYLSLCFAGNFGGNRTFMDGGHTHTFRRATHILDTF